jgi:hypothetical protein
MGAALKRVRGPHSGPPPATTAGPLRTSHILYLLERLPLNSGRRIWSRPHLPGGTPRATPRYLPQTPLPRLCWVLGFLGDEGCLPLPTS